MQQLGSLLRDRQVDLDEVLAKLVEALQRHFDAERATIYLVDHAARELVSRAAYLPEIAEIRLRLGEGIAGWVGARGESIRLGETRTDARFSRRIDATTGYDTRSMLCVPVRDADHVIVAVVQVLNRREGEFAEHHLADLQQVAEQLARLLDDTSLRSQLRPDHERPLSFRFNFIVGASAGMHAVYERVERCAATEATVLVRGETGTGKELIARAVHFNSPRRDRPLVKVDCAALPEQLIENELFGHEKGAYTGADQAAPGKVEAAEGGTLFLDEIGELSMATQGKLLRLLQDRTYLRVGGSTPRRANVRFVAATHRPLETLVEEGAFRSDLYYRLRVVEIGMPPLRERGHADLERLIDHFLFEHSRSHRRRGLELTAEARAALHGYSWPGNVRELEHAMESAVVLSPGQRITPDLFPFRQATRSLQRAEALGADAFVSPLRPLREVEEAYVRHVLELCDGNRSEAARRLGNGRNTQHRKLNG